MIKSCGGFSLVRRDASEIPGQQFVDPIDSLISDTREDLAQIGFRIYTIELRRADQTIEYGGSFTARI